MAALFPPCWPALQNAVKGPADALNLPLLPSHVHVLLGSAAAYEGIFLISSFVMRLLGVQAYERAGRRTRLNWDIHVVSMVQCLVICYFAARVTTIAELRKDRIFSYSPYAGDVYAMACGYFLWDAYISLRYVSYFGPGFAVHGLASLFVFLFSFRPFLNYYGPAFLFFELSTPFVNIHWFLDKLGKTGGRMQVANGVALIVTFFAARIVWGWYMAYHVFHDIWAEREKLPAWLYVLYFLANTALNCLNIFWFSKMIDALRRRIVGQRVGAPPQLNATSKAERAAGPVSPHSPEAGILQNEIKVE